MNEITLVLSEILERDERETKVTLNELETVVETLSKDLVLSRPNAYILLFQRAIKMGYDLNYVGKWSTSGERYTALQWAARNRNIPLINDLLLMRADPNVNPEGGSLIELYLIGDQTVDSLHALVEDENNRLFIEKLVALGIDKLVNINRRVFETLISFSIINEFDESDIVWLSSFL